MEKITLFIKVFFNTLFNYQEEIYLIIGSTLIVYATSLLNAIAAIYLLGCIFILLGFFLTFFFSGGD